MIPNSYLKLLYLSGLEFSLHWGTNSGKLRKEEKKEKTAIEHDKDEELSTREKLWHRHLHSAHSVASCLGTVLRLNLLPYICDFQSTGKVTKIRFLTSLYKQSYSGLDPFPDFSGRLESQIGSAEAPVRGGVELNLNRSSGTELTLGAGRSRKDHCSCDELFPGVGGSSRELKKQTHTPRDIKAVFPNGHSSWAWLLSTPQVITRLQSQITGFESTSVLYKLCDLGPYLTSLYPSFHLRATVTFIIK